MSEAGPKTHPVTILPEGRVVAAPDGATILDALIAAGAGFDSPCGGKGTCGKCKVRVVRAGADPAGAEFALACSTEVIGPIAVDLGAPIDHAILSSGAGRGGALDPAYDKRFVRLDPPSLADQRSDLDRLQAALGPAGAGPAPLRVVRELPGLLRASGFGVTAITCRGRLVGVEPGGGSARLLGMAFDIGTTTVVGYLLDLRSGAELAVASRLNPQVRFGADVISRAAYAAKAEGGLEALRSSISGAIDGMIGECVGRAGAARADVYSVTVVGNTCMHHLFLGVTPGYMAAMPFAPALGSAIEAEPGELGLGINPAGRVLALPVVAGFVGADTVAVVLSTGLDLSSKVRLAIDIGTNGEMVLGSRERMVACSTAAGPAFEGAHIGCGMRGAAGAIDHASFEGDFGYSVIGGGKPRGVCGSGLLDLIAGLVELGAINRRGKILARDELPPRAAAIVGDRIRRYGGAWAFAIEEAGGTAHGESIVLTQRDVAAFQLAKGAIAAGVAVLMGKLGVGYDGIDEVLLAGAFGTYLDPRSAAAVGLIPAELAAKTRSVGNAAGAGAVIAALSVRESSRAESIASRIEHVELAAEEAFSLAFGRGTRF